MLIKCDLDFLKIIEQDPVRPVDLLGSPQRRFDEPFEVYAMVQKQGFGVSTDAVVCVAYAQYVPEEEADLEDIAHMEASLWSNQKGAGRRLINALLYKLKDEFPVITLSPKTDMAKKFHESNGAVLFQENETSYNFRYPRSRE
jgi:hypothetical protein